MSLHKKEQQPSPSPVHVFSKESRSNTFARYFNKKRIILSVLAIPIITGMGIGFIFVAHFYYHEWGGQGFWRSRTIDEALRDSFFPVNDVLRNAETDVCLPMRKIADFDSSNNFPNLNHDPELRRAAPVESPTAYLPNNTYPFFVCGDQAQDCEAYGQPVRYFLLTAGCC